MTSPIEPIPPATRARFMVGETVKFKPGIISNKLSDEAGFFLAQIVAVSFNNKGKVLYDVALSDGEGAWYDPYPLRAVDSVMFEPYFS